MPIRGLGSQNGAVATPNGQISSQMSKSHQKCQHLLQITANMIQQGFDDVTIQNKYHYQQITNVADSN